MATNTGKVAAKANGSGRDQVADATQDVAAQLNALQKDFAGLAASVQNLTGVGASVASDGARAKLAAASDAGEMVAHQALERANEGVATISNYARQKPMVALAAAAGAGLLIGLLTSPRK